MTIDVQISCIRKLGGHYNPHERIQSVGGVINGTRWTRSTDEALHELVKPDAKGQKLLEDATEKMRLSMRGYTRVLRVARTVADLEGDDHVRMNHVAEALSYRQMQFGRAMEEA